MNTTELEQQILRGKATGFQPELDEVFEQAMRSAVLEAAQIAIEAAQIAIEAAIDEEVKAELAKLASDKLLIILRNRSQNIQNLGRANAIIAYPTFSSN